MTPALLLIGALTLATAGPTEGRYRVTRDSLKVKKEVWGLFCDTGARLERTPPGRYLSLTVKDGEWTAKGSGRKFGTGLCEARNKTLAPTGRTQAGDEIVIKCRSRRVTLGTEKSEHRVKSTDKSIEYKTTAKQHYKKQGDDCISILERTTTAIWVPDAKPASTAETKEPQAPPPASAPADPCATPGPAAKVALSPKVFDAKVGGDPKCVEVQAEDENGCAVKAEGVTFAVDPKGAGKVDAKGCFSPSASIKEEEAVAVIARIGGLEAAATARVVPAAEKQATKTLTALAKTSRSKRAREILGEVSLGAIVIRPLETEPPALPPLEAEPFPILPVAGGGGLLLLLSGAGMMLLRRRRQGQQEEATELQAKPVVVPKKGGGLVCPQCSFEFAVGDATHCPFDNTELEELGRDARQTMFIPTAGGMICPVCKTKYPTKARFCGHDRAPLIPDFGQLPDEGPQDGGADG